MSIQGPGIQELREVVGRVSGVDITDDDAALVDLGVKSIDMLVIIGNIQNEFEVEFDEEDLTRENFRSVRSIHSVIERMAAETSR